MSSRGRRVIRILPALATVVALAVVGVLIATDNQQQKDEIAAATLVGQDYLAATSLFRDEMKEIIDEIGTDQPTELSKALEMKRADAPQLATVSTYGREHSASYREAIAESETLLEPYDQLVQVLQRSARTRTFVDAANKVLSLRISDFVGTTPINSSSLVRGTLIPAFRNGLAEFQSAPVPKGQEALAAQVTDAVQYVINQSAALADSIDANRNFSFSYNEQFDNASTAVSDYATVVDGDLAEALAATTG